MPKLNEMNQATSLKVLQYGDSGVGKSIRACSAAQWGPLYLFDFDTKWQAVKEFYKDQPKILDNIEVDTYVDTPEKTGAAQAAILKLSQISKDCKYATVVWDSWTAWEDYFLNKIMSENPKTQRMSTTVAGMKLETPSQVDYRNHAKYEQSAIQWLRSLPCNVFVNCHVKVYQDETTGQVLRGLAAAGKLSQTMPKYFEEVHRLYVETGKRKAQITANYQFPANTTLHVPGPLDHSLDPFTERAYKL